MAVTELTTAPAGSGKSYRRCAHYLCTEYLPLRQGAIWTNFPIHIEEMADYVLAHNPELVRVHLVERIKLIPDDVLKSWRCQTSGPWEYFEKISIAGDRIVIDEIHNFIPKEAKKEYAMRWQQWLGEIRHMGAEFECLSQNDDKIHKLIKGEAGLKRHLFNAEQRRDPFFGIVMADWYNLRAKFISGVYTSCAFEVEKVNVHGKWVESHSTKFNFEPELFKVYDSYSTPIAGGTKAREPSLPYKEKTKIQLVIWFLRRNWFSFVWRVVVIILAMWLCFGGGASFLIGKFIGLQNSFIQSNSKKTTDKNEKTVQKSDFANASTSRPGQAPGAGAVGVVSPDVVDLQKKVDALSGSVEKLTKENEALKEQLERQFDIILMSNNRIILRGGLTLTLGSVIPSGKNAGKTIKVIQYENRAVVLSDGSVISLAR